MPIINPVIPPGGGTHTTTYIKFNSAPQDNYDYDACANTGVGLGSNSITSYSNKHSVFVWGSSQYCGQIKINNILYTGGTTFNSAVEVLITGNYDIEIGCGTSAAGGGSND